MRLLNIFLFSIIFLSACTANLQIPDVTSTPKTFSSPTILTVNFQDREPYETFTELVGKIRAATFSSDKTNVAICHAGTPEIVIWDTVERRQTGSLPGFYDCFSVAFSPNGTSVATGFYSGGLNEQPILVLWDINKTALSRGLTGFEKVVDIEFSVDSNRMAKANFCSIMVYEIQRIKSFQDGHLSSREGETNEPSLTLGCEQYHYNSVSISSDGKILAGGTSNGEIVLWDLDNKKQLFILQHSGIKDDRIRKVEFSHNGNFLASGSYDSGVRVWDISKNTIQVLSGVEPVYSLSFSNDDRSLITGSNAVVNMWDVKNGRELCRLTADTNHLLAVDLSVDENSIFGISEDGQIFIWEIGTECKGMQ
jgi:WD40 repeat protein